METVELLLLFKKKYQAHWSLYDLLQNKMYLLTFVVEPLQHI